MEVSMQERILYHGSTEIIRQPIFGKGKAYNDYGRGFYCTEHPELAKEWACTEGVDGYMNQYVINEKGLHILNLSEEPYTILHWLALLMNNRRGRISTPTMKRGLCWLNEQFLPDIREYDVIIGYRADDSYFSFARAFVNNEISLKQLSYAMRLGKLGEQYVLKSERAFLALQFQTYEQASHSEYYVKRKLRDEEARAAYQKELEQEELDGLYIRDLMREGVTADDERLRF
jgi:hypothetical protein